MARKGRAGAALTIAALASLVAGIVTTAAIAGFGPPLASVALAFGPAEYVGLTVLGLAGAMVASKGSRIRAAMMVGFGLLLAMVGTDVSSGQERYTFGIDGLFDGIDFVPLTMGLFGIAEIIANLEETGGRGIETAPVGGLWLNREELRRFWPAALRGTAVGTLFGALPGGGATISSFAAYALEKRVARDPTRFGRGAPEGVAGPEAANNAGAQAGFIPMLALGIPPNAVMAMMIGAMTIHGITPGPRIIDPQPDLFWGLIVSMLAGNVMLVILNLPLIGLWVRLLKVPYAYMFPAILVFCCVGAYSLNNSVVDMLMMAGFGVFGHVPRELEFEPVPLLMGFVLGKMLEENLRRALLLFGGGSHGVRHPSHQRRASRRRGPAARSRVPARRSRTAGAGRSPRRRLNVEWRFSPSRSGLDPEVGRSLRRLVARGGRQARRARFRHPAAGSRNPAGGARVDRVGGAEP